MAKTASGILADTIDFLVASIQTVRLRDQHRVIHAGVALLDQHGLWKPRGATAERATKAIVAALVQSIFNMFGDAHETLIFCSSERRCGKQCARIVEAFDLQRHRLVREFWTYSKFGLGKPIER